jgi:hypothetical protein
MDADVTGDLSNRTATVDDESYRLGVFPLFWTPD